MEVQCTTSQPKRKCRGGCLTSSSECPGDFPADASVSTCVRHSQQLGEWKEKSKTISSTSKH
eukprot:6234695-Amphidinium_carterae.2